MAPRPGTNESIVSETTGLLKKAYDSTGSLPLAASYEDLRDNIELQLQNTMSDADGRKTKPSPSMFGKKHALCMLLAGCTLCTVLAATFIRHGAKEDNKESKTNKNNDLPAPGDYSFPLSALDPVRDLGLPELTRAPDVSPDWLYFDPAFKSEEDDRNALPTNAWYQNLLLARGEPSNLHRAYPVPYLVDVVGLIPGLRTHVNHVEANAEVMQLSFNENFGLVVGATKKLGATYPDDDDSENFESHKYKVVQTTDLGITLEWSIMKMSSNIVRGMPFTTMEYEKFYPKNGDGKLILPTIASPLPLLDPILVDGSETKLDCSGGSVSERVLVQKDIELYFHTSDFSWMVFFSHPAWITCLVDGERGTLVQVVDYESDDAETTDSDNGETERPFVIRAALIDQCTTNANPVACRTGPGNRLLEDPKKGEYTELLRAHANTYPGRNTHFSYNISSHADDQATMHFHWDPQSMEKRADKSSTALRQGTSVSPSKGLLMFALSHHMDRFSPEYLPFGGRYCKSSLTGPACIVQGSKWSFEQSLPTIRFRASRPPNPHFIPTLATALKEDIKFRLPKYMKRGVGDTYFSGKLLAKLARILMVAEEVDELCGEKGFLDHHMDGYLQFCKNSTLPTKEHVLDAIQELREGVEVWINGKAETPFLYDKTWGGVVSCGCLFSEGKCTNQFPDCPGFSDPGLNFGNGFYNDHHFHYGYHIYAAAAVAHFDPSWGKKNFERVLLLVRDIANPSKNDPSFPQFRHKDWYQGSSWASGVTFPPYLNQKNQESSSEAIAAYEGVALFGQVLHRIWNSENNVRNAAIADEISKVGRLLASTEITSAKKYWHVPHKDDPERIYPEVYENNVVGILWNTMAQFGTWFGADGYLPYGIQLLPLTPLAEERDDIKWMNTIYRPFTQACAADFRCTTSGWSVLQVAVLANVGYKEEAAMRVKELPDASFENAGGNGHSRTNTLWFISTRPEVVGPIPMLRYDLRGKEEVQPAPVYELTDCYLPNMCTDEILARMAGEYTCAERITYLIKEDKQTQWDACWRVGGLEYEDVCGPCNPGIHYHGSNEAKESKPDEKESNDISSTSLQCPPCSQEQCDSDLNRCPVFKRAFVCTDGTSKGGCSADPQFWVSEEQCDSCCEMTDCQKLKDEEAKKLTKDGNAFERRTCPPCESSICYGKMNQCPIHSAPYICTDGPSIGGCSSSPWDLSNGQCTDCCEIKVEC